MKLRTFRPLFFRRLAGMCRRQQTYHLMLPIRNKWLIEVAQREFSLTKADAILTVAGYGELTTRVWRGGVTPAIAPSFRCSSPAIATSVLNEGWRAYV
jgi:hypothetical protein